MKILKRINGKAVALSMVVFMVLGLISCKKEKCSYYNDIMNYYDQSEETWTYSYEQGMTDSMDMVNQLNKIQRERAALQKQYKDCVEEE